VIVIKDLYDPGCDYNYTRCGESTGQFFATITGWHVVGPSPTLNTGVDENAFDTLVGAILEGYGNKDLMSLKSHISALLLELPRLYDDIDALDEVFA
jgi:hypothetical protein